MTTTSARASSPGSKAKTKSGSKTKANSGSSPKGRGGRPAGGKTSRQRAGDAVADRIIELLDQGQPPPWEKDWRDSTNGAPRNAVSMKPYRGVNRWMTLLTHMAMGYQDPRWLTCRAGRGPGRPRPEGGEVHRDRLLEAGPRAGPGRRRRERPTGRRPTGRRPSGRGRETPHLPHAPVLPGLHGAAPL